MRIMPEGGRIPSGGLTSSGLMLIASNAAMSAAAGVSSVYGFPGRSSVIAIMSVGQLLAINPPSRAANGHLESESWPVVGCVADQPAAVSSCQMSIANVYASESSFKNTISARPFFFPARLAANFPFGAMCLHCCLSCNFFNSRRALAVSFSSPAARSLSAAVSFLASAVSFLASSASLARPAACLVNSAARSLASSPRALACSIATVDSCWNRIKAASFARPSLQDRNQATTPKNAPIAVRPTAVAPNSVEGDIVLWIAVFAATVFGCFRSTGKRFLSTVDQVNENCCMQLVCTISCKMVPFSAKSCKIGWSQTECILRIKSLLPSS